MQLIAVMIRSIAPVACMNHFYEVKRVLFTFGLQNPCERLGSNPIINGGTNGRFHLGTNSNRTEEHLREISLCLRDPCSV